MFSRRLKYIIFKYVKFPNDNNLKVITENEIKDKITKRQKNRKERFNKNKELRKFNKLFEITVGMKVLVKNIILSNKFKKVSAKLSRLYRGPYIVIQDLGKQCYLVEHVKNKKQLKVNRAIMKRWKE